MEEAIEQLKEGKESDGGGSGLNGLHARAGRVIDYIEMIQDAGEEHAHAQQQQHEEEEKEHEEGMAGLASPAATLSSPTGSELSKMSGRSAISGRSASSKNRSAPTAARAGTGRNGSSGGGGQASEGGRLGGRQGAVERVLVAPPVDPHFAAMAKRDVVRKQRRQELKERYEQKNLAKAEEEAERERRGEREKEAEEQARKEAKREGERKQEALLVEKQEGRARMIQQLRLAAMHAVRSTIVYRGWRPWVRLMELRKLHESRATVHHLERLLYTCFERLQLHAWQSRRERALHREKCNQLALLFRQRSLMRRLFGRWHKREAQWGQCIFLFRTRHRLQLQQICLEAWRIAWREAKLKLRKQTHVADRVWRARVTRRVWKAWVMRVIKRRMKNEEEAEKEEMWKKVRGWLAEDEGE
jgi:hypothetical protein